MDPPRTLTTEPTTVTVQAREQRVVSLVRRSEIRVRGVTASVSAAVGPGVTTGGPVGVVASDREVQSKRTRAVEPR